jgi:elongation factor G
MTVREKTTTRPTETALQNVRVIGIYAHIDAGKTTTSEAILYLTGKIHRLGSVDDGNTQLDWMEQERTRGITITAAATTCFWNDCRINLIDTPGHIDFTAEVTRSIRVIDGAVIVMCGVGGVETQTETVWRQADGQSSRERPLPRLVFVNKLDRESADFAQVLADTRKRLAPHAVPLQLPIGSGESFRGVVDLMEQRAITWPESVEEPVTGAVPPEMIEATNQARSVLIDAICETDDALLEQRLDGQEPPLPMLRQALRRATIESRLIPVLCGSARREIGIQPLLDAITAYLPSPADMLPVTGTLPEREEVTSRPPDPAAPFAASAFKIVTDQHVGHLTWVRVFSGQMSTGDPVFNPRSGETERVGRIYQIHANRREGVEQMRAGDVVALVGMKSAVTGDTLCDPAHPIVLEPFHFPEPVISVALAPRVFEDRDKLHLYVSKLCEEDPTLLLNYDSETGEQVLSGMGELHLEIAIDRLRSEYGMVAKSSPLQVAYRETVERKAEATGVYRKQSGGHGHMAIVRMRVDPLPRGEGLVFRYRYNPVELPDQYARAAEAGAREALAKGILAGFPCTDLRVTIVSGRYHEIDSDSQDFKIAGSQAVRQAIRQAGPVLLEPVMRADINADEDSLGTIMGDFLRRRGTITEMQVHGSLRVLLGEVPLAEARGYATDLRNMTSGRGTFTLEFRRYEVVPPPLAEKIVEERIAAGKLPRR